MWFNKFHVQVALSAKIQTFKNNLHEPTLDNLKIMKKIISRYDKTLFFWLKNKTAEPISALINVMETAAVTSTRMV